MPEAEAQPPLQGPAHTAPTSNNYAEQFVQTALLAILFAAPALICLHAACVNDADIWWHLRTGEWILMHRAVPWVDPFSGPLVGTPWLAYSWLYEILVALLFHSFGLAGIVVYSCAMVLAITLALYRMVRRLQSDLSLAVLLTFVACFSMANLYTPRPWLFTILLFILELDILMQVRSTGHHRALLWLPPIFCLWANLHIQLVYGLFVLGLAWVESLAARCGLPTDSRARPLSMGLALAASALATLANPYGWRIYAVAYDLGTQAGALKVITELQSMPFRTLPNFIVLFFALASAAAIAWHRRFPPFETALLAFAAVVSFRSQRDVWVMAVVGALVLASTLPGRERAALRLPRFATALAAVAAALALLLGFPAMHIDNARLQIDLAKNLPVYAVQSVREKGYAGPLFNDYNWGGYLMWAQQMPVSIDGRAAFYGDRSIDRSIATWNAQPDWASDAQLAAAGLVIGPVKAPLTQLLRLDPRFTLVYQDKLAAVFIARK